MGERRQRSDAGKTRPAMTGEDRRAVAKGDRKATPGGRRVKPTAAQQAARDAMMVARLAQDWTWAAIAEEAGVDVRTAQRAVQRYQQHAPPTLPIDPIAEVQRMYQGYRGSIGDLQAVAAEAARAGNYSAAVGAFRSANDARDRVIGLLQVTGMLPQDLGDLRHVLDARQIATSMLDSMDGMADAIERAAEIEDPRERAAAVERAVEAARDTFRGIIGIGGEHGPPDVEGQVVPAGEHAPS